MTPGIAIVGMACRYPEADSPAELWENALAGRKAFRRLPEQRLSYAGYYSPDRSAPDRTYSFEAAVLRNYHFDREKYRVPASTFRAADMAHWLALDVAADALADAGFPEAQGLPRTATGVLLGNSLTGEFSRAGLMRLRWPYVRRVVSEQLSRRGVSGDELESLLDSLEAEYKAPFAPIGDESLAGGLSNTIAGRICNYFDFKGGGYTIDGACSSSLLAIANACSALTAGDLDVALAGGVDLSLDPFELVGFAKVGALASDEMRVYDARSAGFWPGEGCGVVVLMRHDEAIAQRRRIYAVVRGWGVSSDGQGGITRPEVEGQLLALQRAYRRAGFGADSVAYFEGHGTGTAVGDATELETLSRARREANPHATRSAIGSIKANIGHTKAAAGVAGLIKATLVAHHQLLPPSIGSQRPHPHFETDGAALRLLSQCEPWPANESVRAGVSSMGFGGINAHVVLEGAVPHRTALPQDRWRRLVAAKQDVELFVFAAPSAQALDERLGQVGSYAASLSRSELTDLAAELASVLKPSRFRAAIVAARPSELAERLGVVRGLLAAGTQTKIDPAGGVMLATGVEPPSIGFLFPGQGSPAHLGGGAWRQRFDEVRELYDSVELPPKGDGISTDVAQPAIVSASLAGLSVLARLGVRATVAVGHSLGELVAYHWAGAFDEQALVRLATARGRAMATYGRSGGAMASIAADEIATRPLLSGEVVIAGINSPTQTVISGASGAVDEAIAKAKARGIAAVRLPVSHAFHSPLVSDATGPLVGALSAESIQPICEKVASTITGEVLNENADVPALLARQMTSPVRFLDAFCSADADVHLWIEVGPGQIQGAIARQLTTHPVVSLDAAGDSLAGLCQAIGAAFVLGAQVDLPAFFADRFTRPFSLDWKSTFLANPCESTATEQTSASVPPTATIHLAAPREQPRRASGARTEAPTAHQSAQAVVRRLVAELAELSPAAVRDEDRLLGDLHLSSIAVGRLVADATRTLGLAPPASPTHYAQATVGELAAALEELSRTGGDAKPTEIEHHPPGVDRWVRPFHMELVERPIGPLRRARGRGDWKLFAAEQSPLARELESRLTSEVTETGVALVLPPRPDERVVGTMLAAAKSAIADGVKMFLVVEQGGGGSGLAKTLHLERPEINVCVVDVSLEEARFADTIIAECLAATGYTEAHYDAQGVRRVPVARPLCDGAIGELPIGADDVLLVTGGGKGIAAECALSLAKSSGARLVLLGRSLPTADAELAANLKRFAAAGVAVHYASADVCDESAVARALSAAQKSVGPITAVLHGAGSNVPELIESLDEAAFVRTLRPKLRGLQNVMTAVDANRLKLLVAFGSIIARSGMRGEADYATANEWLAREIAQWQKALPRCKALCIEWSVWSGVGMGERLGRIDALAREGITAITPDEGVQVLDRLLRQELPTTSIIVSGRIGQPPTLDFAPSDLPLLRFLERPRAYTPGVELIVDAELSADTDPYLSDHVYQGAPLLPAVVGLEAMAQAAMALAGATAPPVFENATFDRPVVVPPSQKETIRVAALLREPGRVDVVLRAAETHFQVDHFRATCRFDDARVAPSADPTVKDTATLPIACDDLYGSILFHRGRFRRVSGYRKLRATECIAELSPATSAPWFASYLPQILVLGEPGSRDATIHAIQACIPQGTLLPIAVERLISRVTESTGPLLVHAVERRRDGDDFTYDVNVLDDIGAVVEQWIGLRLRRVADLAPPSAWALPLLAPYLERRLAELVPGAPPRVAVEANGKLDRRAESDRAIIAALGQIAAVHRRPDGKPEVPGRADVSVTHAGELTLAVAGERPVACDAEIVTSRPRDTWHDLLGPERSKLAILLAQENSGDADAVSTRVWAATECLKKAGIGDDAPLVLRQRTTDGWVILMSGELQIATWVGPVQGTAAPVTMAVLTGNGKH